MWQKCKTWYIAHPYVGPMVFAAILLLFRVQTRTFWMDETAVLEYLKFSPSEFLRSYVYWPDNHPPLYYFLVLLVSKMLPWTELTIRLVSILAGIGIVGMVYIFTERVTADKTTARLAAGFTALSSYFVLISQMARYHSVAAFFALVCLYFFYKLYVEGDRGRTWIGYLVTLVVVGYVDYPHFIYVALLTNGLYFYRLARRRPFTPLRRWLGGQVAVAIVCLPLAWMLYHRIFIQGDGGFHNVNLLSNSWVHIVAGMSFHVYSFFFGENVFPWNYVVFGTGCLVLVGMVAGAVTAIRHKKWRIAQAFIPLLTLSLIVLNTFFMNVADRRYNFIVYPKFGFVAYPLAVMTFVLCLRSLRSAKIQAILFCAWGIVALAGLTHFYGLNNYLNASYFNTFRSFEYVRDQARDGDYLAITPDAGEGVYHFYRQKYFVRVQPVFWREFQSSTLPVGSRIWFFATGSDAPGESVSTESIIPAGYTIKDKFDSVPLDPRLKYWKEKILHRPSYTYKYTVFRLEKI